MDREVLQALLDYDPETGVFTWRERRAAVRAGAVAGRLALNGYVEIGVCGRLLKAHRLAWIYCHDAIPEGLVIDHINGVKTDNRIANLRPVTPTENNQNRHRPAGRNSVVGVTWDKAREKWRADIKIGSKCVTLGRFDVFADAVSAHVEAKKRHHRIWPELIGADGAPEVPAQAA